MPITAGKDLARAAGGGGVEPKFFVIRSQDRFPIPSSALPPSFPPREGCRGANQRSIGARTKCVAEAETVRHLCRDSFLLTWLRAAIMIKWIS